MLHSYLPESDINEKKARRGKCSDVRLTFCRREAEGEDEEEKWRIGRSNTARVDCGYESEGEKNNLE